MVRVHPFSGLRYNQEQVGSMDAVIAPPYDVITPEERDRLQERSPYNIVRLILSKEKPGDNETENRYTRAAADYWAWREQGVLAADDEPSFYVVRHTFSTAGKTYQRLGFLGLLEFEGGGEPSVYRHEKTLEGPRQDRTRLLDALPANLSPVFCISPDAAGGLQRALQGACSGAPSFRAFLDGQEVELWAVHDEGFIATVQASMKNEAVLIADGHHRFSVASSRADRYGAVMVYFVSMHDPALVVWPIHRVIRKPSDFPGALDALCEWTPMAGRERLLSWLQKETAPGRFGCYAGGRYFAVTAREQAFRQWMAQPAVEPAMAQLDVSVLHHWLLPAAGIEADAVGYWADPAKAEAEVDAGDASAAWFVRGIRLEEVYSLARGGHYLSPKSTYFFPKVLSGLVINPHEGRFSKAATGDERRATRA